MNNPTENVVPHATTAPELDNQEQESVVGFVRKHPAAFIAGGILLGVVAGALLPRGTGRRLAKSATAVAVAAGQAGLHLSQQARDTAEDLTREGREVLERNAEAAQRRATELAGNARETGSRLVEQAVELAARVRQ